MTNAQERKYKDQIIQLKSQLRDAQEAAASVSQDEIEVLEDKLQDMEESRDKFKLDYFRVCNALLAVQNAMVTNTGALELSGISLSYKTSTTFATAVGDAI